MSQPVTIYLTGWCPYCARARALLGEKQASFKEIDIDDDPKLREDMMTRTGRRTVPQIFIGDTHVGGYDDLAALDRAGRLMPLLSSGDAAA